MTRLPKVLMAAVPACLLLSVAMIALSVSQSRARSIAAFRSTIPGKELRTGVSQPAGRQTTLEPQSYKIRIDFREPLRATVQATLTFPDGRLFTHEHAGGYEWSDFIKDIRATREDGSVIPIQSLGPGQWGIKALTDEAVRLSYNVDLSFNLHSYATIQATWITSGLLVILQEYRHPQPNNRVAVYCPKRYLEA